MRKESSKSRSSIGLWVIAALTTATIIGQPFIGSFSSILMLVLGLAFVFWHGGRRYGSKGIISLFIITEIVGNVLENVSIATGFPFGNYHYTHSGVPFLFQVPITIGIGYFSYGYLAWCLASVMLGDGDERTRTFGGMIMQPVTAAFIMVMWDVVMDPISSTVSHSWIWENGGGFNGVPLTNYLGWFLTVWIIFQAFAIFLHMRPRAIREQQPRNLWAMPIMLYGTTALGYLESYLLLSNHGTVIDATGRTWSVTGIYQSASIVMLFTMLFATYLSTVTLLKSRTKEQVVPTNIVSSQSQSQRMTS